MATVNDISVKWSEEDGAYVARKRVGGSMCSAHGDTKEAALAQLKLAVAAMEAMVADRKRR